MLFGVVACLYTPADEFIDCGLVLGEDVLVLRDYDRSNIRSFALDLEFGE